MTFRLYVYYCALCGAWMALLGWLLGRGTDAVNRLREAGYKGLLLGLLVSLGLSLVDAVWSLSLRRFGQVGIRGLVAVLVGTVGGALGGLIGQALFGWRPFAVFLIFGWTITGLLIGAALGVFEVLAVLARREDLEGAVRKIRNGVIGGAAGGLLGGFLSVLLKWAWGRFFQDNTIDELWSPSATGFVLLGLCIGLLIGLAQVILKDAWVKVEKGRRAGRELLVSKAEVTIGRAEGCDIGLFGDAAVERLHARIVQEGSRYLLSDADTPGGTYLNDRRIDAPTPLRSGDAIRVGGSVLRFGLRHKANEMSPETV